jgi:hypothetical protein
MDSIWENSVILSRDFHQIINVIVTLVNFLDVINDEKRKGRLQKWKLIKGYIAADKGAQQGTQCQIVQNLHISLSPPNLCSTDNCHKLLKAFGVPFFCIPLRLFLEHLAIYSIFGTKMFLSKVAQRNTKNGFPGNDGMGKSAGKILKLCKIARPDNLHNIFKAYNNF